MLTHSASSRESGTHKAMLWFCVAVGGLIAIAIIGAFVYSSAACISAHSVNPIRCAVNGVFATFANAIGIVASNHPLFALATGYILVSAAAVFLILFTVYVLKRI